MAAGSSSSADPPGFRLGPRLGEHTWEATQVDLGRRVALRRLPAGTAFDAGAWPHRDGVVGLFAAVETDGTTFVATRFVPGARSLAQLHGARQGRRRRWLDEVEAILDGAVHGDLTEHDVLIDGDGRALVTGFGRAGEGATADDDRAALARLREPVRSGRALPLAAAIVALLAAAGVAMALRGDGGTDAPPPIAEGASAVGSALTGGRVRTLDCEGLAPGGGSPPCTIVQTALPGHPLGVTERSLARGFAVRGATGRLRLQVVRETGGRLVSYNISRTVTVADPERAHYFRVDLSVPAGARFALEVGPGGGAGLRRGVPAAATARFLGPLNAEPRRPERLEAGQELLLRVDVVPRPG